MAYYQENTLSIASRKSLAQLLSELINNNQAIEDFRESLASLPDFDSLSLFRFLDREQKGFLAEKDLEFVVGTKHRKLLTYAFSWVDVGKVGEVSRFEFAAFLMPREDLQLREAHLKNLQGGDVKRGPDTLSVQFRRFQGLLKEVMSREMRMIDLRRVLLAAKDYSLEALRFALTNCERQWICAQDLLTFMQNYGFEANIRQAEATVEAVTGDGEGKITMQQLKWIAEGLENKEKEYLERVKAGNRKKPFPKPNLEEGKVKRYFSSQKSRKSEKQQEFTSLISRIKAVERQEKKSEKILLQSQQSRIESARKACEQQIVHLRLKREQESVRKAQQREAMLAHHQRQLELDRILLQTARLEQESERLLREQNRMIILEDSATIKRQIQEQLCAQEYERIMRANLRQRLVFSPPHAHSELRRASIDSHIRASEEYLHNARYAHKKIMRDRKQQSLIFNKENEMMQQATKKKTPGSLLNKAKPSSTPTALAPSQECQNPPEVSAGNTS